MQVSSSPQSGVYPVSFFKGNVFAAFSGRRYPRAQFDQFLQKAGISPAALIRPKQVHGCGIILHNSPAGVEKEADAIMTNVPGPALGIITADCIPAFFWDPVKRAAALTHAGWRGLQAGILEKTVLKMRGSFGSDPGNIQTVFGPFIRACCYEVSREFSEFFPGFYKPVSAEKGKMDLAAAARAALLKEGIVTSNLHDTGICTSCRHEDFFSARRGDAEERILSVIQIR